MTLYDIHKTTDNKLAGSIRILLALLFFMSGVMKLLIPMLAEAWSGQLLAANIPLYTVSRWTVPFIEIVLGAVLAIGAYVRPVAVVVMGIMAVATYVHLVVDDPSLSLNILNFLFFFLIKLNSQLFPIPLWLTIKFIT